RQEIDFKDFTFKKARIFDVVGSPRLRHRVECNGFFARLTRACRGRGWELEWIGERRAARRWDGVINPDGIGRIRSWDRQISFFLEYDRGTENHDQLANKTYHYRIVGRTVTSEDALLFVFPSAARERYARSALIGASVPVATTVRADVLRHPLGPVWLPLDDDRRRTILDLPRLPRDDSG
ncbi:MAG TPA: replication-relaxation family protein, partial [Actinomycetota bacterium]|nr:replication-relaxation family protein [Actinomycetota bacterium]